MNKCKKLNSLGRNQIGYLIAIAGFYSTILKVAYQESQNIKVLKNDSLFGIILKANKAVLQ
ncbi:hypothetical protein AR437_04335 [Christensenella hongkongensis]|nr:hypothetical protein AR437_04335 [Christensenella hongkongensis]